MSKAPRKPKAAKPRQRPGPKAAPPANGSWAGKLVALRTHYRISQEAAATKLKVPVGTWRNWEQGRRQPSESTTLLITLVFADFFKKS